MQERYQAELGNQNLGKQYLQALSWVKTANLNGKIPFLLFTDEDMDKPYVYLYLATEEASGWDGKGTAEVRRVLFDEIKASLRPTTPGRQDCEVELKELTLNISHIRHDDFIICEKLVQTFRKKPHTLVPYGKKPRNIKLQVLGGEFAVVNVSGFDSIYFRDKYRRGR
jgi:hypothetical protein